MSVMPSPLRSRPAAIAALALVATLAIPTAAQAAAPAHHPAS
ncbi:lipase, partial [Clavibacter michiganensis]